MITICPLDLGQKLDGTARQYALHLYLLEHSPLHSYIG